MHIPKMVKGLLVAAIFLVGCQIEDIVIDVLNENGSVYFFVHEKDSKDPVPISTFSITETYAGKKWEIATYDLSWHCQIKDGKRTLKPFEEIIKSSEDRPKAQDILVDKIKFGELPQGFSQSTAVDNPLNEFEEGREYWVFVTRGAHRGRAFFKYQDGQAKPVAYHAPVR